MTTQPVSLSDNAVFDFPGLFPDGSEPDKALRKRRGTLIEDPLYRIDGDLADFGLIDENISPPWNIAPSKDWLEGPVARLHDAETLIVVDHRIRFCRYLLDTLKFPYDREDIVVIDDAGWAYVSEAEKEDLRNGRISNPLDEILMISGVPPHSPQWFAAKCLAHVRRADYISSKIADHPFKPEYEQALVREWMLFGETWAEARFIVNHGKVTVTGKKINKSNDSRRMAQNNNAKANAKHRLKIVEKIASESRLSGGSLENLIVKRLWQDHNIEVCTRTVRRDLKKVGQAS